MPMIEQSRGYDFVVVGFSNDGRAMFVFTVVSIAEFERWKTANKEYMWRLFKASDYAIHPYICHEQISIFEEHTEA